MILVVVVVLIYSCVEFAVILPKEYWALHWYLQLQICRFVYVMLPHLQVTIAPAAFDELRCT